MATEIDKEAISAAYEDVRNDTSDTNWAYINYDGPNIILESVGTDYDEFLSKLEDDQRAFAYIRVFTGDEMSKRAKFALITWIGAEVSPLKKAKMSTDKTLVKEILQIIAKEIQTSEREDLALDNVRQELVKAGGANYGTGDA